MSSYLLILWNQRVMEVHSPTLLPKKKAEPIATLLAEQLKQLESQDLQQILSAIQSEMRSRQDVSISPTHEGHPSYRPY